ncbi:hypothetical protein L226DRAFT_264507 [Lentinus tigrinus ALCF2SS1-7]|uniref:uncharacterized protein n=1 Tax=Lentinus tigrinus ALCF2SS1-7 TaxID=1328758 RepID=UPI0011661F7D|nr:hypothetical protein L226DRAFT_264507 [Lentinus tigrinus ALCF2SS1-7]
MNMLTWTLQSCSSSTVLGYILDPIQYFPWAAFSAMRCFALSHHRLLSIFVFLLSIVPLAINLVVFHFDATGVEIPDIGTCLMAADLILILVTWYRLSRNALQIRERATFAYVLLRDGTTYFIALFTLNALQLTLTLLSFHDPLQNASQVSFFTEPLTAILVSRMLINLQSVNARATGADWTQQSGAHSVPLAFERVVGSLGASIPAAMEDEGVEGEGDEHGEVGRETGVAV